MKIDAELLIPDNCCDRSVLVVRSCEVNNEIL